MLTRVAELDGVQLDLMVAVALGLHYPGLHGEDEDAVVVYLHHNTPDDDGVWRPFCPTTCWADTGPLLDTGMDLNYHGNLGPWSAEPHEPASSDEPQSGETAQLAICRAFVAARLGDEVEL
jgi:hypothetical protein